MIFIFIQIQTFLKTLDKNIFTSPNIILFPPDRGAVRDLGEWAGQCGHPDDREGDPGLGLQDEDDHGGPQGVRHGDPGRARQLTWTCALYIF